MSTGVFELYRRHLGDGQGRVAAMLNTPLGVGATGALVHTADGRELLNCGGYGVFFVGAGYPAVLAAVREQLERQALSTRSHIEPDRRGVNIPNHRLGSSCPFGRLRICFPTDVRTVCGGSIQSGAVCAIATAAPADFVR